MAAVARQLEEQLKFYREIGVADIGGSLPAAKPALEANPAVRLPVTVAAASPPEINADRQESMPKNREVPGQAALFGDLLPTDEAAPAARALPVIESQDPSLEAIREEISPNNIILVGPTGVGKTEIARRLAKLAGAPFIKVEASKFTEVGYVGRDVESMVRDLVESAVNMVRSEREAEV